MAHQLILAFLVLAPKWIKMFVLDEADEMLSRGFKDQIYEIFQKLSTNIQVTDSNCCAHTLGSIKGMR